MSFIGRFTSYSFYKDPRFGAWDIGIKGYYKSNISNFMLGHGQESFYKYYQTIPSTDKDKIFISTYEGHTNFDRVHNGYIQALFDGGTIGFIFYILIFFLAFEFLIKENKILALSLIAFFIHVFFVFDVLISSVLFYTIFSYGYFLYKQKNA